MSVSSCISSKTARRILFFCTDYNDWMALREAHPRFMQAETLTEISRRFREEKLRWDRVIEELAQNAGAGTAGQVLVSGGASAVPTWQTLRTRVMKAVHVLIIGKRASGKTRLAEKLETIMFHPSQVLFIAQTQYLAGHLDLDNLEQGIDYVVLMQDSRNSERLIADVRRVIDDAHCTPQVCEALRKANENAASPLYGYAFIDTVTRHITWQPGGNDEDAVQIN